MELSLMKPKTKMKIFKELKEFNEFNVFPPENFLRVYCTSVL